jgi:hypothetical protein
MTCYCRRSRGTICLVRRRIDDVKIGFFIITFRSSVIALLDDLEFQDSIDIYSCVARIPELSSDMSQLQT